MGNPSIGDQTDPPAGEDEVFGHDDYVEIFQTYFSEIVRSRSWAALPAGWHNPYSAAAGQVIPTAIGGPQLQQYGLDEAYALEDQKKDIVALVGAWEGRLLSYSELTLTPSVSSANLATIAALASLGFQHTIFETPTYYASIDQAVMLGQRVTRIPSYRANNFEISLEAFGRAIHGNEPCSVWITQPRFGLGTNQSNAYVLALAEVVGPRNVLVIDEAAEQSFPSSLSGLIDLPCPVVRTRGLVKGIGLNGLRIAFVIHPPEWRQAFEDVLETTGSSLDRFSLINANALARDPVLFSSLLAAARTQVTTSQKAASVACIGSPVEAIAVENGYMSTFMIDLRAIGGTFSQKRYALLSACARLRMPIVLKVSAGFAKDESWEGVRINYFTPKTNAIKSAELLVQAVAELEHQFR